MLGKIIGVVFLILLIGGLVGLGVSAYNNDLSWRRAVQDKFELADSASSAQTKSAYFDQFVQALKDNGLTNGPTNLWQQSPRNDLSNLFNITLSLQFSLHNLVKTCNLNGTTSFACSNGLQEISITEFCWYPIDVIRAGWDIQHGWGLLHGFATDQSNRCASNSSSGG